MDTDFVVGENISMLDNKERFEVIDIVFSMLGDRCKELLTLYVFENKKMAEIQKLMGMNSEEVVKSTKYRCKKKMKEVLMKNPEYQLVIRG